MGPVGEVGADLGPYNWAALGLDACVAALSPDELISAILRAPVDLLWNGGIGTYVKASQQTDAQVGDRSNDAVRVSAPELRARVVAEGGNLGLTQAARIEYALGGGLVDTDFIDSSGRGGHLRPRGQHQDPAGRGDRQRGDPDRGARRAAARADRRGGRARAAAQRRPEHGARRRPAPGAEAAPHVHARYLRQLARQKRISLQGDGLPGEKEIAARRSAGTGLTTPELALLLAHTKIAAGQPALGSDLPDDPALFPLLAGYFPAQLRERFADQLGVHRLRREIITTSVINEMVDTGGSTFLFRLAEETGLPVPDITRAWLVAREVFGMSSFWQQVDGLAGVVDVDAQDRGRARGAQAHRAGDQVAAGEPAAAVRHRRARRASPPRASTPSVPPCRRCCPGVTWPGDEVRRASFAGLGVPALWPTRCRRWCLSYSAFDIVMSASASSCGIAETAAVYFAVADRLQLGRLRDLGSVALPREDRWGCHVQVGAARRPLRRARRAHQGRARRRLPGRRGVAGRGRGPGLGLGGAELRRGGAGGGYSWPRSGRATGSPSPPSRSRFGLLGP